MAGIDDLMVEYAIGKIEDTVCSTKYITIEEVMIDVVDRYICINDAMGPVKSQQSDKQGDARKRVTNQHL
jgi:hypothetical protein